LKDNRGFTIAEVVIAIVILSVGILGLAGTAASVTRMVGRSQQYSKAASLASARFEILRSQVTPVPGNNVCATLTSGSTTSGNYTVAWTPTGVTNGWSVRIVVTSPTARGFRADTLTQLLTCAR
jgi:prepilin-type N-terminal cleavage/methylation domain-containing protein